MSKWAFHISSGDRTGLGEALDTCYKANSPIKGLHCLDQNLKADVIKYSPVTKIIYRHQHNGEDNPSNMYSGTESDIRNRTTNWLLAMKENWVLNPADYYSPFNEPNPATLDEFVKLNIIMDQSITLANSWGIKLALPALTTGTPSDDGSTRYEKWNKLVPSLIRMKNGGHILNLHEYGFHTTLRDSAPYHALRFRSAYDFLVPRNADPQLAITECSPFAGFSGNEGEFKEDLTWYDLEVMYGKYNNHVLFFCAYQLGGKENCYKMLPDIAQYIASNPDKPVIDPPDPTNPPVITLPYVVTAYLGPQNASIDDMKRIQSDAFNGKSTVSQSADDVKFLVKAGKEGSKAIIYNPQSFPGGVQGISDYFKGLNTEFRYLTPNSDNFRLKSPILDIPFRVTDVMGSPRPYGKHEGLDLDSFDDIKRIPVPVYACADGVVEKTVSAGTDPHYPGYGNYIIVKHTDVYKTWYCHLGQVLVSVGTRVIAGSKIAISGNSGTPTPPIHLHLNLQKIGGGQSGYVVPDVVNPLDYMDVPATTDFKSGVGVGNQALLTSQELSAINTSKVKSIKIFTLPDYNQNTQLVNQIKNLFIVSRLFFSPNPNSPFNPQAFVNYCKNGIDAQYKAGVRYFEVHNEPNLTSEGYGWNWPNGREFGNWLIGVLNILRPQYPEAKFGYPGLSPQPNTEQFFKDSKFAADQSDWVGTHAYWNTTGNTGWGMESIDGGMYWKKYLSWTNKPLYLTEFSNNNPNTSYSDKGKQYKQYFNLLGGLNAAFCFALSWPGQDINKEAWVIGTTITQIPYEVGL